MDKTVTDLEGAGITGRSDCCRLCGRKLVDQSDLWAGRCNNDEKCAERASERAERASERKVVR